MKRQLGLGVVMVLAGGVWGQVSVSTQPGDAPEPHGVSVAATAPARGFTGKLRFPLAQPAPRDPGNAEATLLTLDHEGVHPVDVWMDVFKQVGAPVRFTELPTYEFHPVTVHVKRRPYWEVVEELEKGMDVRLGFGAEGKTNVLFAGPARTRRAATAATAPATTAAAGPTAPAPYVSGAFKVEVGTTRRVQRFGAEAEPQTDCDVELLVTPEPGVQLRSILNEAAPDVAVDENGLSLLPETRPMPAPYFYPLPLMQYHYAVKLGTPAKAGDRIATLKGVLHAGIVSEYGTVTLRDSDWANQTFEYNQVLVHLQVTAAGTDRWVVSLKSERSGDRPESFWQGHDVLLRSVRISLMDGDGVKFTEVPRSGGVVSRGAVGLAVSFQRNPFPVDPSNAAFLAPAETRPAEKPRGPAKKIGLEIPTVLKEVTIRYEFKDLAMP